MSAESVDEPQDTTSTTVAACQTSLLPASVCLRVTRACNARCRFCLAPPDGHDVSYASILRRLEWLRDVGVAKVHLCGGEPTIRRDLPAIVSSVRACGLACAMTTNGIEISFTLLRRLFGASVKVKVSVHGPQEFHDGMMGRVCFERVDDNIRRLRDAGVTTAIQTVVTRKRPHAHEWAIEYCLKRGIRKLRLIPFIPRGRGLVSAHEFQLDKTMHQQLIAAAAAAHEQLRDDLDVRVLDFWTQEYFVLETDGRLQIQRETDAADATIAYAV
jgi:MoaA/NifB/PqqE/SkfB family radical SAM enzyme